LYQEKILIIKLKN